MRSRHLAVVGAALLISVIAAGCASRSASTPAPAQTGQENQPPPVGVVLREFEFEPRPLRVKAGRVRFLLMNRGSVEHDFAIPSLEAHNAHGQHVVKPGRNATVEIELTPGMYEAICTIPGHKEAGMVVKIEAAP